MVDNSKSSAIPAFLVSAYNTAYGKKPNSFAALGYDSAAIMISALKAVDDAHAADETAPALGATAECRQAIIDAMAATDLDCVTGHITFDENNNPIKDCTIIGIENGAYKYIAKY